MSIFDSKLNAHTLQYKAIILFLGFHLFGLISIGQVNALFSTSGDTVCYQTSTRSIDDSKKIETTFIIAVKNQFELKMISRIDLQESAEHFKNNKGFWVVDFDKLPKDSIEKYGFIHQGFMTIPSLFPIVSKSVVLLKEEKLNEKNEKVFECLVLKQVFYDEELIYEIKVFEVLSSNSDKPTDIRISETIYCKTIDKLLFEIWVDSSNTDVDTHKITSTHSRKDILSN